MTVTAALWDTAEAEPKFLGMSAFLVCPRVGETVYTKPGEQYQAYQVVEVDHYPSVGPAVPKVPNVPTPEPFIIINVNRLTHLNVLTPPQASALTRAGVSRP
jgi:hypothetical protein